ncbi:HET-domain-containing protein [Xylaria arbuscula]|nr:HET-domain-containing protein [Xylaria arbuscula]
MSLDRHPSPTSAELCKQCRFLFSSRGFEQLASTSSFRHSQIGTFVERPYCRFCRYLWNEDLLGSSSQVYKIRCLRDLLGSASRNTHSRRFEELKRCWVIVSRPTANQYIMGSYAMIASIEPYTVPPDLIVGNAIDRVIISVETEKGQMKWQSFSPLRFIAPKSSPLSKYTNYRHVTWDGLTKEWVADIKDMLNCCLKSHPQCQSSQSRVLPSRLLHIMKDEGNNFHVQLVATDDTHTGEYAALSYCWGGPQALQLTKTTVRQFLQQPIDWKAFPNGLSDAVEVTSSLELEYLWVDALCIVQDDQDDKKREISRMSAIYQNSFVTIAAATSNSVQDSFLRNSSILNTKFSSCDIPMDLDTEVLGGSDRPSILSVIPVHAHRTGDFPLNKRGWAFQEALLPPRLLVFGDLEPFVRCRTKNVIRKSLSCIEYSLSSLVPRRIIDSLVSRQYQEMLSTDHKDDTLDFVWREIVEQYTLRELSIPEDRPLAISGVVDFLSEAYSDECYFGVWKSCPIICLLWKAEPSEVRTTISGVPTWSWMSVTGPVDLDTVAYFEKPEASVEWDVSDLSHTRLMVTCCVFEAEGVHGHAYDFGPGVLAEGWSDVLPSCSSGLKRVFKAVEHCTYLVLARETSGRYFAIAATDEGGGVYRRCGLVELRLPDSWHERPKQHIVLI